MVPACRKIWEAFLDNEVLLNGERVKKKSTSVRRVSVCLYHKVLGLSSPYKLNLTRKLAAWITQGDLNIT